MGSAIRSTPPSERESWEISHSPRHRIQQPSSLLRALLNPGWGAGGHGTCGYFWKATGGLNFSLPASSLGLIHDMLLSFMKNWNLGIGRVEKRTEEGASLRIPQGQGGERRMWRDSSWETPAHPPAAPAFQLLSAILLPTPSSLVLALRETFMVLVFYPSPPPRHILLFCFYSPSSHPSAPYCVSW